MQIARHFGAKRIIVTERNPQILQALRELGTDQLISLVAEEEEQKNDVRKGLQRQC